MIEPRAKQRKRNGESTVSLLDRVILTDMEIAALPEFEHEHNWTECAFCARYWMDAQCAKSLWAVVDWLGQIPVEHEAGIQFGAILARYLRNAGIERPVTPTGRGVEA